MSNYHKLGLFLKNKRIEAGYTQLSLSQALQDVSGQFISNWERGLCAPPSHAFQKVIKLLNIDREDLVSVMLADCRSDIESRVFNKKTTLSKK